ncbi:hypothetical protein FHS61_000258 [Altererythrobacter atlanticus]|uniref:Uncharacterized protein n=1 Tax=Croceibacterium atlanticum TaxID=1267766 RepID=A0A0F7KPP0_9SPHN|nr:hypothetical protein [Croceibacterium atlanticum]AKH42488.1 hypothetical protein WYH_01447 [Croceibacterium atlanticum]MBB5731265.1 hypothetical protein [Croceibacterium atlanticum]
MDREHTYGDQRHSHIPPATPPVVNSRADQHDAAELAPPDGDADAPGSAVQPRGGERADQVKPGKAPDEFSPDKEDTDNPGKGPAEIGPGQGDTDGPDVSPPETPAVPGTAPVETPPPPD